MGRAARPPERRALIAELVERHVPRGAEDPAAYVAILRDATEARNGWKRILAACRARAPACPAAAEGPAA